MGHVRSWRFATDRMSMIGSRFWSKADVTGLGVGSARSRTTQNGHQAHFQQPIPIRYNTAPEPGQTCGGVIS